MTKGRWLRTWLGVTLMVLGTGLSGNVAALADPEGPWTPSLQQVDAALARKAKRH